MNRRILSPMFLSMTLAFFLMLTFCLPTAIAQKSATVDDTQTATSFEQSEKEAIEFVQEHHPELVSLLESLKSMREKEYQVAIREISKTKKRLDGFAKRGPEIYVIELDAWKIQSKIDLLVAKGIAREKEVNSDVMRGLLTDQVENQKKRWKNELETLAKRQKQISGLLQLTEGHEEEKIDQQLAALQSRVGSKIGKSIRFKQEAKSNP
jgi:hypothetical protein